MKKLKHYYTQQQHSTSSSTERKWVFPVPGGPCCLSLSLPPSLSSIIFFFASTLNSPPNPSLRSVARVFPVILLIDHTSDIRWKEWVKKWTPFFFVLLWVAIIWLGFIISKKQDLFWIMQRSGSNFSVQVRVCCDRAVSLSLYAFAQNNKIKK